MPKLQCLSIFQEQNLISAPTVSRASPALRAWLSSDTAGALPCNLLRAGILHNDRSPVTEISYNSDLRPDFQLSYHGLRLTVANVLVFAALLQLAKSENNGNGTFGSPIPLVRAHVLALLDIKKSGKSFSTLDRHLELLNQCSIEHYEVNWKTDAQSPKKIRKVIIHHFPLHFVELRKDQNGKITHFIIDGRWRLLMAAGWCPINISLMRKIPTSFAKILLCFFCSHKETTQRHTINHLLKVSALNKKDFHQCLIPSLDELKTIGAIEYYKLASTTRGEKAVDISLKI